MSKTRQKYTWQEPRNVVMVKKLVISGDAKQRHMRKVKTWKKRRERRHV